MYVTRPPLQGTYLRGVMIHDPIMYYRYDLVTLHSVANALIGEDTNITLLYTYITQYSYNDTVLSSCKTCGTPKLLVEGPLQVIAGILPVHQGIWPCS